MNNLFRMLFLCVIILLSSKVFSIDMHYNSRGVNVHTPYRWIFADSAARVNSTVSATDTFKLALQKSDSSSWILMSTTGVKWRKISISKIQSYDSIYGLWSNFTYNKNVPSLKAWTWPTSISENVTNHYSCGAANGSGAPGWTKLMDWDTIQYQKRYAKFFANSINRGAVSGVLTVNFMCDNVATVFESGNVTWESDNSSGSIDPQNFVLLYNSTSKKVELWYNDLAVSNQQMVFSLVKEGDRGVSTGEARLYYGVSGSLPSYTSGIVGTYATKQFYIVKSTRDSSSDVIASDSVKGNTGTFSSIVAADSIKSIKGISATTANFSNLASNNVPYKNSLNLLATSPIYTNGANVAIGKNSIENWSNLYRVLQIGGVSSIASDVNEDVFGQTFFMNNMYMGTDGAWKPFAGTGTSTDNANMFVMRQTGEFSWYSNANLTADVAFTPTLTMSLSNTGLLSPINGISTTTGTFSGTLAAATVNTGNGACELYPMNQGVRTTDSVAFRKITSTRDSTSDLIVDDSIKAGTGVFSGTVATGNLSGTTGTFSSALTCATINTGNGACEVYPMNQDVRTSANPTFNEITIGQSQAISGKWYYDSAFTVTWAGFSETVTSQVRFTKIGKIVTLYITDAIGASNSDMFGFTLPAPIRPKYVQHIPFTAEVFYNNDEFALPLVHIARVEPAGAFNLKKNDGNLWASTGTKGFHGVAVVTYSLY